MVLLKFKDSAVISGTSYVIKLIFRVIDVLITLAVGLAEAQLPSPV